MSDTATLKAEEVASMEKSKIHFKHSDSVQCRPLQLSTDDMKWWRDAKFGMFIHWGLYAIPAKGEWHMHVDKVDHKAYARLADEFNPHHFDGAEWAGIAKDTHMRYMVLTARHHDGFALWDSPSSFENYCSARTAAKRDFVAEYTSACRAAGLRVGLYYSPMDWRFPGYFRAKELLDNALLMKAQCHGQVEELMKNYGQIDVLWYDGAWLAHKGTDADAAWLWEPLKLNTMVRKYQPKIAISPRSGFEGDFICDEGGHDVKGPIIDLPWEKCLNLNKPSWGYNSVQDLMTRDEVIAMLINVVGRGGNVLLNVGPDREGRIPPEHVSRLREVGAWLDQFGKSIFATRPGPFQPVDKQYCATHRDCTIYLHLLAPALPRTLSLPPLTKKITACSVMGGGNLAFKQTEKEIQIELNGAPTPSPVTVLELTIDSPIS
jgi:alpha-L-fucosidase